MPQVLQKKQEMSHLVFYFSNHLSANNLDVQVVECVCDCVVDDNV